MRKALPMVRVVGASASGVRVGHGVARATKASTGAVAMRSATPPGSPRLTFETGHLGDAVRQHHGKEDQDEDAADVDEELRHREEVGREEDVERAGPG